MSSTISAVDCGWKPCANRTTNPNGFCHHHQGVASINGMIDPSSSGLKMKSMRSVYLSGRTNRTSSRRATPKHEPRDEQIQATTSAIHHFESGGDRCQIRAACGMGKTTMHQMIIDEWDQQVQDETGRSGVYVVVAPSIELAKQLRREYEEDRILDILDDDGKAISGSMLSVHHNVDSGSREVGESAGPGKGWRKGMGKEVDIEEVKEFLQETEENAEHPRIAFIVNSSTSIGKFAQAQRELGVKINLAVFDESHKYATEMKPKTGRSKSKDKDDEAEQSGGPARIFFNEDEGGLDADKRLFTTATIKGRATSADSCFSEPLSSNGKYQDKKERILLNYKMMDEGQDFINNVMLAQDDEDLFGPVVESWSFSYAVNKGTENGGTGYLVKPSFEVSTSYVNVDDVNKVYLDRKAPVMPNGDLAKTGAPGAIRFSTYQTLSSTMETLVAPSDEANSSPHRNVLVFADGVSEIDEARSRENWRAVALSQASRHLGGAQPYSEEQAKQVLRSGKGTPDQVRAARYVLIADHADIRGCHSNSSMSDTERKKAFDHFDKKAPGDSGGQTCETIGNWNPCAKVVVNHDMFTEGLNIPAIDTVVMNRPRLNGDESVYQAIGRSSRNWFRNGVNQKSTARVVIPSSVMADREGNARWARSGETTATLRSISRIWRDQGETGVSDDMPIPRDYWLRGDGDEGQVSVTYMGNTAEPTTPFWAADSMYDFNEEAPSSFMPQDDAYGIRTAYEAVENSAKAEYRKNKTKGAPEWKDLNQSERYRMTMASASNNADKTVSKNSVPHAFLLNQRNPSPADVEMAMAMTMDINTRRNRADYVESTSIAAMERGAYSSGKVLHDDGYSHPENEVLHRDRFNVSSRPRDRMTRTLTSMLGLGRKRR